MDLTTLNSQQLEAVLTTEGPLLILAGAGSGKTNVLVHRIAYLIEECNVSPYNILAITFTNKAANEMRDRIIGMIGEKGSRIWARTFHSACLQILRFEVEYTDLKDNFGIYDTSDQLSIVKRILKQRNIDAEVLKPSSVLNGISKIKNKFFDLNEGLKRVAETGTLPEIVIGVIEEYQATLKENNAIDFDDILCIVVKLFKTHPEVLERYQDRFQYIMVDEYQDTNGAQYELVTLLAAKHRNICVVGDDDQCIYEWRGADIKNILGFEKDYPEAKVIKLEQNYRSKGNILNAANVVIVNNSTRKSKVLRTEQEAGSKIKIYRAYSDGDEGTFVANQIEKIKKEQNKQYKDFAILYRTNAQSRIFEESLRRAAIAYKIVGGTKFYDRKEIKDMLSYLKVLVNPSDSIALRRIINVPKRGIGDATIQKVLDFAESYELPLWDALSEVRTIPTLTARNCAGIEKFMELMENLMMLSETVPVSHLIETILEDTGYIKELEASKQIEDKSRIENLKELVSDAVDFEKNYEKEKAAGSSDFDINKTQLEAYLEKVSLVQDTDKL